jgi:hypothetical protein
MPPRTHLLGKDETMAATLRNHLRCPVRLLVAAAFAFGILAVAPSTVAYAGDGKAQEGVGYVLTQGRARTIAFPGAASTVAAGVNDRGEIVGKYKDADGRDHGFLRTRRGRYRRIDVPGAGAPRR